MKGSSFIKSYVHGSVALRTRCNFKNIIYCHPSTPAQETTLGTNVEITMLESTLTKDIMEGPETVLSTCAIRKQFTKGRMSCTSIAQKTLYNVKCTARSFTIFYVTPTRRQKGKDQHNTHMTHRTTGGAVPLTQPVSWSREPG